MRLGDDKQLDQALYLWFKQKRIEGVPVTGPLLCAKALELSRTLSGETNFQASEGWKWRFCQRHGIRQLSVQGEKLSSDKEEADKFVSEFRSFVMERGFTRNQILTVMKLALIFDFYLMQLLLEALRRQ